MPVATDETGELRVATALMCNAVVREHGAKGKELQVSALIVSDIDQRLLTRTLDSRLLVDVEAFDVEAWLTPAEASLSVGSGYVEESSFVCLC